MLARIEQYRGQIEALCIRHGVARLYVFGSALRGEGDVEVGDVDLLVELRPMDLHARVDAYFSLLDALRALFETDVDLVMMDAVTNRFFRAEIDRTKRMLYAA